MHRHCHQLQGLNNDMNKHAGKRSTKAMRKDRGHDTSGGTGRQESWTRTGRGNCDFLREKRRNPKLHDLRRPRNQMPQWEEEIREWVDSEAMTGFLTWLDLQFDFRPNLKREAQPNRMLENPLFLSLEWSRTKIIKQRHETRETSPLYFYSNPDFFFNPNLTNPEKKT